MKKSEFNAYTHTVKLEELRQEVTRRRNRIENKKTEGKEVPPLDYTRLEILADAATAYALRFGNDGIGYTTSVLERQLKELKREMNMRISLYPRWVREHSMHPETAAYRKAVWAALIADFEAELRRRNPVIAQPTLFASAS